MEVIIKYDKDGKERKRIYRLVQGDTFGFVIDRVNETTNTIDKFVFKLGIANCGCKIDQVFEQDFKLDVENKWVLSVASEETAKWLPSCDECGKEIEYYYEIEAHFIDGNHETAKSGEFIVKPQIGGAV